MSKIKEYLEEIESKILDEDDPGELTDISNDLFSQCQKVRALRKSIEDGDCFANHDDLRFALSAYLEDLEGKIDGLCKEADKWADHKQDELDDEARFGSYEDQVNAQYRSGKL